MLPSITAFISPGGGELIMIMLVLILLFGAKDAPRIFRKIHTFLDKMQRMAADFRYKVMYGDLSSGTTDHTPYDAETEEPDAAKSEKAPHDSDEALQPADAADAADATNSKPKPEN